MHLYRDSAGFLKWGCMRCFSTVRVLPTVDGSQHAPSLKKQCRASVLHWKGLSDGNNAVKIF